MYTINLIIDSIIFLNYYYLFLVFLFLLIHIYVLHCVNFGCKADFMWFSHVLCIWSQIADKTNFSPVQIEYSWSFERLCSPQRMIVFDIQIWYYYRKSDSIQEWKQSFYTISKFMISKALNWIQKNKMCKQLVQFVSS